MLLMGPNETTRERETQDPNNLRAGYPRACYALGIGRRKKKLGPFSDVHLPPNMAANTSYFCL